MRLLFSLLDAGLGGGQQVATWLAEAAVARGHQVGLLVPDRGPTCELFETVGAQTHLIRLQRLREPRDVGRAARILRDYDVLWSHNVIGGQLLGDLAARKAGCTHLIHQHTYPQFSTREPDAKMQRLLSHLILGQRSFIAVAPHVRDGLVALGVRGGRIHLIPNGVPIPSSPAPPRKVAPIRIGLLGRFDPGKGMLEFAEAAWRTGFSPEEATFTIGGSSGPFKDYEAEVRLRAAAAGVSVEEPGPEGVSFLARQDIVVIPSRYEGSPLTLLEAMALGKAVIASDIPGVTAITGAPGPATIVPVGDVEALANAVSDLVREPARTSASGLAARELVAKDFHVDRMTKSAINLVELMARGDESAVAGHSA
jgi:glycosyltransferase involved in cell wall biosynthesis